MSYCGVCKSLTVAATTEHHKDCVEHFLKEAKVSEIDHALFRHICASEVFSTNEKHDVHYDILKLLLVHASKSGVQEALEYAASLGNSEHLSFLIPYCDPKENDSEALRNAAYYNSIACLKMLLPISDPKAFHSEALYNAASEGNDEIVQELLPFCDAYERNYAPIRYAAKNGHLKCVKLLIPFADKTALFIATNIASKAGHTEIARCLHTEIARCLHTEIAECWETAYDESNKPL